jgi:hypothetical protein
MKDEIKTNEQLITELTELRKNIRSFIHSIGYTLTVILGNIDIAIISLQRGETKDEIIKYLLEAQNEREEVNELIHKLSSMIIRDMEDNEE